MGGTFLDVEAFNSELAWDVARWNMKTLSTDAYAFNSELGHEQGDEHAEHVF